MKPIIAAGALAALAFSTNAQAQSSGWKPPKPVAATSSSKPIGAPSFKPFKGTSVYSNRGGVNAYPKPAKPQGYMDPNKRTGF